MMDVWFGLRIDPASQPWFTAIVVLTPGLGIAVNTTVFSFRKTRFNAIRFMAEPTRVALADFKHDRLAA